VIKPPRLHSGDTIGVIAPGSPVNHVLVARGTAYLEELGYTIRTGKYLFGEKGYLAGSDWERADDVHRMFFDSDIKAIILARGGYGSVRLLELLDYDIIRNNPKIFSGYSDATSLQCALLKRAGLITFSGPMVAQDFGSDSVDSATSGHFWDVLTGKPEAGNFAEYFPDDFEVLYPGSAEGRIICGCLTVLTGITGTAYCPDLNNAILILEDIGEEPYRLDRAFMTLKHHGVFEKISGLVLGQFVDCRASKQHDRHISVPDIVAPIVRELRIPTMANLSYGHISGKLTIPFGSTAVIDTESRAFHLTESAVV